MLRHDEKWWDKSAKDYKFAQWEKTNISRFDHNLTKKSLLKFLRPNKNDKILEIGCGPGTWTKLVSGSCKELTAVDVSKKMLKEAKMYCLNKNVSFIHGDFMKLNFNQKFDKIFAVRAIEYVENKDKLLEKMNSLLKVNGKIVLITKSKPCLWNVKQDKIHRIKGNVSHSKLKKICVKNSFKNVIVKPVI